MTTAEGSWPHDRPLPEALPVADLALDSQQALDVLVEQVGAGFFDRNGTYGDFVFLRLARLDEYAGSGPIVWLACFSNTQPHAQLYATIDDETGTLLSVKAYGEGEQEYWLRPLAQTHRLSFGEPVEFYGYFTLTLNAIDNAAVPQMAVLTLTSSEDPSLTRGFVTYPPMEEGSQFYFGGYVVHIIEIVDASIAVEVMPLTRWFVDDPGLITQ